MHSTVTRRAISGLSTSAGSAVADRDPRDLSPANAEAGPRRIGALACRESANPVQARPGGEVYVQPACPDMHAGAGVKAAPGGLDVVDPLRELVVEPVRDEHAATKVREDATA